MTFDLRKRLFIIIGIGVGLLLALIFGILFLRDYFANREPDLDQNVEIFVPEFDDPAPGLVDDNGVFVDLNNLAPIVDAEPTDKQILQIARDFVERYSTYSNQNDSSHIEEVLPLVTNRMADWLEDQKKSNEDSYRGVTSRVVAIKFVTLNDVSARVSVDIQQEVIYRLNNNIRYKSGIVDLIKIDKDWKIDGLFWE